MRGELVVDDFGVCCWGCAGERVDTDFRSRAAPRRHPPYKGGSVLPDARTALMMPGKAIDLICRDDADTEEKSGGFSNRSLQI
jgi:hypothetical protein